MSHSEASSLCKVDTHHRAKTSVQEYTAAYSPLYLSMATKRLFDYNKLLVLIFMHDEMQKTYF